MRTEFGVPRSSCSCSACQKNCRFMPGHLIPADLDRIIPPGTDPFVYAEHELLASPGAKVINTSTLSISRIGTLVPAVKRDGSCIHLNNGLCDIHSVAPFGCAFFSCTSDPPNISKLGLISIVEAFKARSLYAQLWIHLYALNRLQFKPEFLREKMRTS